MFEAEIYYINKEGEFGHEKGLINVHKPFFSSRLAFYIYTFKSSESELECIVDEKENSIIFENEKYGMIYFWTFGYDAYSEDAAKEKLEIFLKRELEYFEIGYRCMDRMHQYFLEKKER